jgi:hypothetical protein
LILRATPHRKIDEKIARRPCGGFVYRAGKKRFFPPAADLGGLRMTKKRRGGHPLSPKLPSPGKSVKSKKGVKGVKGVKENPRLRRTFGTRIFSVKNNTCLNFSNTVKFRNKINCRIEYGLIRKGKCMSKGHDVKKSVKKKAQRTLQEKRLAKRAKREGNQF